jgi:glyoxylase I family protein
MRKRIYMEILKGIHHIAIICSDYERSKRFYTEVLGFTIKQEVYREERRSYKLDLCLGETYIIELFSFPDPAPRPTNPEAAGLRHLAFRVVDIERAAAYLKEQGIETEPVRVDEYTGRRFTFFRDPDQLPLELYEQASH